jgi:ribosomal protein S18 acetylase RimI-like enzyme
VAEQPPLRDATRSDLAALAALWLRAVEAAWLPLLPAGFELPSPLAAEAKLADALEATDVVVADGGGTPLGFVSAGPSRDPDALSEGEVWHCFVDPGAWRGGLGARLLGVGCARLRDAGHDEVTLWSFRDNERANAFYERQGFRRDGAQKRMAEWDYLPLVRYRRTADAALHFLK